MLYNIMVASAVVVVVVVVVVIDIAVVVVVVVVVAVVDVVDGHGVHGGGDFVVLFCGVVDFGGLMLSCTARAPGLLPASGTRPALDLNTRGTHIIITNSFYFDFFSLSI